MIDLHSHTNESDGTFSPAQLIAEAARVGVDTLGITDHDTFAGYALAVAAARDSRILSILSLSVTAVNGLMT